MPQIRHSAAYRPVSRSPPPFAAVVSSPSFLPAEDVFFQPQSTQPQLQPQPNSIVLLARGISLLSITQLRDLLREYSLPTGGNKHILVNRMIIYLETFGQTQQNLLTQFSAKLKSLLSVEPQDAVVLPEPSDPPTPEPVYPDVTHRLFSASPSCLFEVPGDLPIPFGPILFQLPQMIGFQHTFSLPLPPGELVPLLQFASAVPSVPIRKLSIQLGGVFTTFRENTFWLDVSEFINRQGTLVILQIEPAVSIVAVIRWMQRVPLPELAQRILTEQELAVPTGQLSGGFRGGVCPLTRKLIARPARGVKCQHDDCFDLTGFLAYAIKNNSWACPICHVRLVAEHLRVDPYYFQFAKP